MSTGGVSVRDDHSGVVLAAIDAARTELLAPVGRGTISNDVLRVLERELDLVEMTIRRRRGEVLG